MARLPRLMKDLRDEDRIEELMRSHGVDINTPINADTRMSAFAATSQPIVTLVASDHIKVAKPNRTQSSTIMKHHRVNS